MSQPIISIVVIAYDMPRQVINTIFSLSSDYQENVSRDDYEIILVENHSPNLVSQEALNRINANITYIINHEQKQSPAHAINVGISKSKGRVIGIMIDGARITTPRIIEYALMAYRSGKPFLAAVPSYNLGEQQHQYNIQNNYSEDTEKALLDACRWKENGYRLFDISSIGDANQNGIFNPLLESNCYFSQRENFDRIGGANEEFSLPGGGSLNLHMFRQLGVLNDLSYYLLISEGTFHQFHGGVTTSEISDREAVLESHRRQLHSFWDNGFHAMRREPILLGSPTSHSMPVVQYSAQKNMIRAKRLTGTQKPLWPDDKSKTDE